MFSWLKCQKLTSILNLNMHQNKYSSTWRTYSDHLRGMMKELMITDDFADVTIVTEDKKYIKGHKNILSLCSPVFKEMLQKERNSNSIIFLRGINFPEIESIMQFVYLGEATFYEESTDEYLAVAKLLEIEELCNAGESDEEPSPTDQNATTTKLEEQADSDQMKIEVPQDTKYLCDQCDYQASHQSNLTEHIQSRHEEAE